MSESDQLRPNTEVIIVRKRDEVALAGRIAGRLVAEAGMNITVVVANTSVRAVSKIREEVYYAFPNQFDAADRGLRLVGGFIRGMVDVLKKNAKGSERIRRP